MQTILNQSANDETWMQIAPLLDAAMDKLGRKDHDALVLRFFENKSFAEVGAALGTSEDAAKMRVSRALERLRKFLSKRGASSTTAILAGTISTNSIQAAPVGLAKTICAVSISKGSIAAVSTLALVKGTINFMTWIKTKTAIVVGAGMLLAAGTTATVFGTYLSDWGLVNFKTAPPLVLIQPTHFPQPTHLIQDGQPYLNANTDEKSGKMAGRHVWLKYMIEKAYEVPADRLVIPHDSRIVHMLTNYYDFLVTTTNHPHEKFQLAIKQKFGLVGIREAVKTDVLLLKVHNAGASGLKAFNPEDPRTGYRDGAGFFSGKKLTLSALAGLLTSRFKIRVINQTELTNRFDIDLAWGKNDPQHPNLENLKHALLDQLGLELIPTNMPIEMLFIERAP